MSVCLELRDVWQSYGEEPVLKGLSLKLNRAEKMCLFGPSGCGKTTVLRVIAGFEKISGGEVLIDSSTVASKDTFISPEKRRVGFVFQDYALFPHLSALENVAFGLRSKDRLSQARDWLNRVKLSSFENRYPHELSGGQKQRIALVRALAPRPKVLLLDEPFSSLDADLKEEVSGEILEIISAEKITALFVAHEQDRWLESLDRFGTMENGRIELSDRPGLKREAKPKDSPSQFHTQVPSQTDENT